ncbi:hypothetical protein HYT02_03940 [Candidatus Gottesmanbacteria bacterium]|nr:hypothetical protein [Candidatus Gottesmanbacteria bacterium]
MKSYTLYILIAILAVFQIIISNRLASYGRKISDISVKTNEILLENERIKKNIASSSAILTLTKRAEDLGFTKQAEIFYIDEQYPVAQNSF